MLKFPEKKKNCPKNKKVFRIRTNKRLFDINTDMETSKFMKCSLKG